MFTQAEKDAHYKSQWHRYNVKRRAVGMPRVPRAEFEQNLKQLAEEKAKKEVAVLYKCTLCRKKFKSEGQLETHFLTKKHKAAVKKYEIEASELGSVSTIGGGCPLATPSVVTDSSDWVAREVVKAKMKRQGQMSPIPLMTCLFCPHEPFDTIEKSLQHMQKAHGFEIPFIGRLTGLEGLLMLAGRIIGEGHSCPFCWKGFHEKEAVWNHMEVKRHQRVDVSPTDESMFDPFYDWTRPQSVTTDGISHHIAKPARQMIGISECGELEFDDGTTLIPRDMVKYMHHPNMRRLYNPDQTVNLKAKAIGGRVDHTTGPSKRELQWIVKQKIRTNTKTNKRQKWVSQMHFKERDGY